MAFSMPQMPGALCGKPQGRGAARLACRKCPGRCVGNRAELGCIANNCVGNHVCKDARCVANGG